MCEQNEKKVVCEGITPLLTFRKAVDEGVGLQTNTNAVLRTVLATIEVTAGMRAIQRGTLTVVAGVCRRTRWSGPE